MRSRFTSAVIAAALTACGLAGCATPPAAAPAPDAVQTEAEALKAAQAAMLTAFPKAPPSPPLPAGPLTRVAFASCSSEDKDQPAFTALAQSKPDLAVLMGDNVYGSGAPEDPLLSDLRASYVRQLKREEFTALVGSVPTLAMYDDHDFGKNDAGGDFPQKDLAQAMFDAFWSVGADDPRAHPEGGYGAWMIGPEGRRVQVILLDTRFHRSPLKPTDQPGAPGKERYLPDADPGLTVLGETQWAWLEGELKKPAQLRLIVSSIQVVAEGHGWEKWGNFPLERQRLLALVKSTGAKGVLFFSGDRHYASLNAEPAATVGYPLYDLTASAINMPWNGGVKETIPTLASPAVGQENFGLLEIDWEGKTLALSIRDKAGQAVFTKTVAFAEIGA